MVILQCWDQDLCKLKIKEKVGALFTPMCNIFRAIHQFLKLYLAIMSMSTFYYPDSELCENQCIKYKIICLTLWRVDLKIVRFFCLKFYWLFSILGDSFEVKRHSCFIFGTLEKREVLVDQPLHVIYETCWGGNVEIETLTSLWLMSNILVHTHLCK